MNRSDIKSRNNNLNGTLANSTAWEVLLYVPNLIGYSRVIATIIGLVMMTCRPNTMWEVGLTLYLLSFVFDLFDGMAARHYHQTSNFGSLLDMITDRCSTAGLLQILSHEYGARGSNDVNDDNNGSYMQLLFSFLVLLDVASHWCQMYSTLSCGGSAAHHKSAAANVDRFFLVRWYYGHYFFFGYCCVGAEITYVILYALARLTSSSSFENDEVEEEGEGIILVLIALLRYALLVTVPGCFVKQIVNVSQLCSACYAVASHDAEIKNNQNSRSSGNASGSRDDVDEQKEE